MDLSSIGRNVCKYRLEKHLRQEDLAERAGLSNNYTGIWRRRLSAVQKRTGW